MLDLTKLNSITKYPSILTYHKLAEREKDGLIEELISTSTFEDEEKINIYEKIDGENSRIVLIGDGKEVDYFIGSRKELLHAKGDRISIPTGNIANYFKSIAEDISEELKGFEGLIVIYFESYGGNTPKTKNYSNDKTQNGRIFDVFELTKDEFGELLSKDSNYIANWRDNGNQPYYSCEKRVELAEKLKLTTAPLLDSTKGKNIPKSIKDVYNWLNNYKETKVGINSIGKSEGVIIRTNNREKIAKIRFEDYEKTFRFLERQEKEKK